MPDAFADEALWLRTYGDPPGNANAPDAQIEFNVTSFMSNGNVTVGFQNGWISPSYRHAMSLKFNSGFAALDNTVTISVWFRISFFGWPVIGTTAHSMAIYPYDTANTVVVGNELTAAWVNGDISDVYHVFTMTNNFITDLNELDTDAWKVRVSFSGNPSPEASAAYTHITESFYTPSSGVPIVLKTALLEGVGEMGGLDTLITSKPAALSATSAVAATTRVILNKTAALAATSTVAADGFVRHEVDAALAATSSLSSTTSFITGRTAALAATSEVFTTVTLSDTILVFANILRPLAISQRQQAPQC